MQVSVSGCGTGWTVHTAGMQHLTFRNTDSRAGEAQLIDRRTGGIYADVEPLGPATSDALDLTLAAGSYAVRCLMEDEAAVVGPTVTLTGPAAGAAPAVLPVDQGDLIASVKQYQQYVAGQLPTLIEASTALQQDLIRSDITAGRRDWLAAHLVYERLGAAYGAFGDADGAINGLPDGLPQGVADPGWTGFHRIEYGLWHGQTAAELVPLATRLIADERSLQASFPSAQIDPNELTIRAHEITENALQFELTGQTDYGSDSNLATVAANLAGTATVLGILHPLLATRDPQLPALTADLTATAALVQSVQGQPLAALPQTARERIDSAVSELCELLASVATVLEPRKTS